MSGTLHRPAGGRPARRRGSVRRRAEEARQERKAVVDLVRRSGQEARHQDTWRRCRRRLARPEGRRSPSRRGSSRHRRRRRADVERADLPRGARPRDDHRGGPGAQDVGEGGRGHQGADETGPDGHHQPGARPGYGDDPGRRRWATRRSRPSSTTPRRSSSTTPAMPASARSTVRRW